MLICTNVPNLPDNAKGDSYLMINGGKVVKIPTQIPCPSLKTSKL
jgi:hypothetical protein